MFEELTAKLETVLKKLRGYGKLTPKNIQDALREVKLALLEADVNYKVVKDLVTQIEKKAIGQEVLRSLTPGQQVVKIVHEELTTLLGSTSADIELSSKPPTIVMLVGLQGSGKTTVAAKLAKYYKSKGKLPLLVAADIYRPAATLQLQVLAETISIPIYTGDGEVDPVRISKQAITLSLQKLYDIIFIDTAGRLHIDQQMMEELRQIREAVNPHEILLVVDSMTGQDAVTVAHEFTRQLDINGSVLTKLDGDARGGAALSIRAVTGKPIKFVGVGEKLDAIEQFHPQRMASRILGMGDVLTLIEKAEAVIDVKKTEELEKKLSKEQLSFDDFLDQLHQIKKMGPLDQLLSMIPGLPTKLIKGIQVDDQAIVRVEAIINSMTKEERRKPWILNGSRRKRIAVGSGTSVQQVNQLLKQFEQMQKLWRQMKKKGFDSGFKWRFPM